MQHRKFLAFTLVEVLVSLSVVAVLSALLLGWKSSMDDTAKKIQCVGNLRTIGSGIITWAADRNGMLWSREEIGYSKFRMLHDPLGLPELLVDYVPSEKAWLCPAGISSPKKFGNNYTWTVASQFDTTPAFSIGNPSKTLLVWDAYNYALPSMYNASDDVKGNGSTGPASIGSKYQIKPHGRQKLVNWLFFDGHVITGATSAQ